MGLEGNQLAALFYSENHSAFPLLGMSKKLLDIPSKKSLDSLSKKPLDMTKLVYLTQSTDRR